MYTYDRNGLLTAERDPLGHITTYTRDANYNLTASTDPLGRTTQYTWDAPGCRYTAVTDALHQTTHFTYDPAHHLTAITDPLNRATALAYDTAGNLIQLTNALGYTATFTYNPAGQIRTSTDARGATTTYDYDLGGNLATVADALGHTTLITHDVLGRPLTVTNALGHSAAFTYAAGDRLVRSVDALGAVTTYTYDAVGHLTGVTDPRGAPTTFTYDHAGYLTAVTDPLGGQTTYTYDVADAQTQRRLTAITDANGHTTALFYDAAGRLTMSTDAAQHPTWYAYDAVGNLTAVTDALQRTTAFQYDALNRTVAVTDTLGQATWYGYNAVGQVVAVLRPDGGLLQYTYDALDRPQSVSVPGLGTVYQYAYDAVGNLTQVTNAANVSTHYTYDALRRMTQAVNPAQQATAYAYDGANRMVGATSLTTTAVYTYNGDGLLIAQAVNGVETTFTWDQALDLPQLLADSTGARYLYGLERIGVQQDGAWSYPLSDALGSVRQWTNAGGAGADPLYYDPFGVPLPRPTTPAAPFGYTGEWTSAATGLQYLRARWYDPATGRFTQVDPFPGVLSLPGTQQPYSYALNNPLRYSDPSGKSVLAALALVGVGIIGGFLGGIGAYAIKTLEQATPCMPWHRQWNWGDALDWGIKGEMLGGLIALSALGLSSFIVSPWAGLVMARLGLAFFGGVASGIGYAIPAMMFGTFDPRQFAVAVGVGALFGAFPEFLGGAGIPAIMRGALANELQYIGSAVVSNNISALWSIKGHAFNFSVGGLIGKFSGASLSPKFDAVWVRTAVPEVYENISGRYAQQFLWEFVDQTLRQSRNELMRSSGWSFVNNFITSPPALYE